jgi:crossover junction endodeoxyribonuclease RuvC
MVVFGIDPGSTVTGWAVISHARGRLSFINGGAIKTSAKTPMGERLHTIHQGLTGALRRHSFDEVAIEAIFKHKSAESAIRLGQARGVALLAAASLGFEPVPYNAMTVKATVGCHGRADKQAVARMVIALLGTTPKGPADVTDACAIAITHCLRGPGRRLTAAGQALGAR